MWRSESRLNTNFLNGEIVLECRDKYRNPFKRLGTRVRSCSGEKLKWLDGTPTSFKNSYSQHDFDAIVAGHSGPHILRINDALGLTLLGGRGTRNKEGPELPLKRRMPL